MVTRGQDSEGLSGSAAQETAISVLGPTASRVVAAQGKSAGSKLTPSLFVVQAQIPPLVVEQGRGTGADLPKKSTDSHGSGN